MIELIDSMLQGDSFALSRLITAVENDEINVPELMRKIHGRLGQAYHIGITGPPGAGKSTLTAKLIGAIRKEEASVGVIACDPSSPYSGGAILGDRIRMGSHFLDDDVFIRSMANRGNLGGLPQKIHAVASLLDAFGKDFILIETVGVGQTEVEIRGIADTNLLVLTPMAGDHVQAMKSGIIEIADIFIINKIDLGEANTIVEDLSAVIQMRSKSGDWSPPILKVQAIEGTGIAGTIGAVKSHRRFLQETGLSLKRHEQHRKKIFSQIMKDMLLKKVKKSLECNERFMGYLANVEKGELNPYMACEEILMDKRVWQDVFSQLTKK